MSLPGDTSSLLWRAIKEKLTAAAINVGILLLGLAAMVGAFVIGALS